MAAAGGIGDPGATTNREGGDVSVTQQHGTDRLQSDAVFVWRRGQLVRSGFPEPLAERIARDERYDLHRLVELAQNGCSPELALRILAPLDDEPARGG